MLFFSKKKKPQYTLITGKLDGLDFVGHYDLRLLERDHKNEYPYMLGISVQGFGTDERKLPTNNSRATLDTFEDTLISLVEKSSKCLYAGHSFWNGALEIIFYVKDYERIGSVLKHHATQKHPFQYAFKLQHDPEWEQLKHLTFSN